MTPRAVARSLSRPALSIVVVVVVVVDGFNLSTPACKSTRRTVLHRVRSVDLDSLRRLRARARTLSVVFVSPLRYALTIDSRPFLTFSFHHHPPPPSRLRRPLQHQISAEIARTALHLLVIVLISLVVAVQPAVRSRTVAFAARKHLSAPDTDTDTTTSSTFTKAPRPAYTVV